MGKGLGGNVIAVVDIASASAGVAIFQTGDSPRLIAFARESLSLEERSDDALSTGVIQMLASAGEKVVAQYALEKGPRISSCYCIIGAPWTHTFAGRSTTEFKIDATITEAMINDMAKQSLADQKDIKPSEVFEASVVRVLLNGYTTDKPAGKRAESIRICTLMSDCDLRIKDAAKETVAKLFPSAEVLWRSSARAALSVTKRLRNDGDYLIAEIGAEATDFIIVRKGILVERALVPQGFRQLSTSLAKGKPVEETIALLDMYEKQQVESEVSSELEQSIAKLEPGLAHLFGETLGKLSALRKLPEDMVLLAPPQLATWLSRFFARIDFTQFTSTARPFSVSILSAGELLLSAPLPSTFADPGLAIGSALAAMELDS